MQDKLWLSTISVGRELVLIPYGNFARTAGVRTPITRAVTKVGKKYFYLGNNAFSRVTGEYIDREECNGGYVLYPDMAAYGGLQDSPLRRGNDRGDGPCIKSRT